MRTITNVILALALLGCGDAPHSSPPLPRIVSMTPPALLDSSDVRAATQRIAPSVELAIGYSAQIDRVRMRLTVRNGASASGGIERFAVANLSRPYSVHSPPQWLAWYGWPGNDSALVWSDLDTLTAAPPAARWQKYPSPHGVMPGDSALEFTLFTRTPPRVIRWYAQGFDTIPGMDVESPPELFNRGWTGTIYLDVPSARKDRRDH
jgi:hypothetical protein